MRIIGLIPQPSTDEFYQNSQFLFGTRNAGHLIDLTRDVYCRPSSGSHFLQDLSPDLSVSSNHPLCPITMSQAPKDMEIIESYPNSLITDLKPSLFAKSAGGLGQRPDWSDQLMLGLYKFGSFSPQLSLSSSPVLQTKMGTSIPPSITTIMPSIYGPIQLDTEWLWRDWRSPTVRRWMFEGFQIHVTQTKLRKIQIWKVPIDTVTTENERKTYDISQLISLNTYVKFKKFN